MTANLYKIPQVWETLSTPSILLKIMLLGIQFSKKTGKKMLKTKKKEATSLSIKPASSSMEKCKSSIATIS